MGIRTWPLKVESGWYAIGIGIKHQERCRASGDHTGWKVSSSEHSDDWSRWCGAIIDCEGIAGKETEYEEIKLQSSASNGAGRNRPGAASVISVVGCTNRAGMILHNSGSSVGDLDWAIALRGNIGRYQLPLQGESRTGITVVRLEQDGHYWSGRGNESNIRTSGEGCH